MPNKPVPWTRVIVLLAVCLFLLNPAESSAQSDRPIPLGLGFIHPLQCDIDWSQVPLGPTCTSLRQQTYVFFANGIDPLNLGEFYGLCQFVRRNGYPNTYFGQMACGARFRQKIKQIREGDPQGRIVLIGFSGGVYVARRLANDLQRDGIDVDLLVYLGGDLLCNKPNSRPCNAKRILNVTANGFWLYGGNLVWKGVDLDDAVNMRLPVSHLQIPSRLETIQLLMNELGETTATPTTHP
jgi:hypothetical protein